MAAKTIPIDTSKTPPSTNAYLQSTGKYWKTKLTNNDFLQKFYRDGIARKIIVKIVTEMTKYGCNFEDEKYNNIRHEYNMDDVAGYALMCAYVSGYSLIYTGYSDVANKDDYSKPPRGQVKYFYVIPRAWVARDIKENGIVGDRDQYDIYSDNGSILKIHKDRILRVSPNKEERSMLEAPFNALDVADNILWSVGQAMWRAGQGFPVLTVQDPQMIPDGKGGVKSELEILGDQGVLRDINAMTGFLGDARYNLDFKGAQGKALNPGEYWNIAIDYIAACVDLPRDIIIGVSAGAVTGSETNTRELASNIESRQRSELEPIYDMMFQTLGYEPYDIDYEWLPTYVQSQKEQAETLEIESRALSSLVISGILDTNVARETLKKRHEWLEMEGLEGNPGKIEKEETKETKSVYNVPESKVEDSLIESVSEPSTMPPKIQISEVHFMKDMVKKYAQTDKTVQNIFAAFNTD